ncbi:DUF262 domain-containing protein [Shewanella mesophila]|uniref:DUF262 domain-containing protein n=1 Tax=Shewanella mesophila TaxID=2864208 RepID=UPI001C6555F4|nr:DUF262 domain-containing protein [Shewanella mesophila]QYJ86914.1 DUF262 domain-containing protein [Shewanella mesophila]
MQFIDVLQYLERMVGLHLQPINNSTETITILEVDYDNSRYLVKSSTNKRTRTFSELKKIWSVFEQKGYVSVDQALNGSGSSRHQPETILANLPFVEHFKYEKKKHLFLKDSSTHELGTLKELSNIEAKKVRKRIDRYRDFDISQFYIIHRELVSSLENRLNTVFTKYPGESDVDSVQETINRIKDLEIKLSEAVVNIDLAEAYNTDIDDDSIPLGTDSDEDNIIDEQISVDSDFVNVSKGIVPTRITQISPTVSLLYDRVLHDEIDLKPEYQRKDRIWPIKDRARLIESILLGLPLPVFYFAERANKDPKADVDFDWVVIDGLQRTTTLVDFMKGEFALKELTQIPQYNTFMFKDLPRKEQRKIREYQIQGHLIQVSNDSEEMIRELFHRINTYGKNLSYQEIRSALYPGSSSRFCKYFASDDTFINSIPAKISSDRMLDVEYVLRATSFLILGFKSYNYKTNDDFLCEAMKTLNQYSFELDGSPEDAAPIFKDIDYRLKNSLRAIKAIFGNDAFKKEAGGKVNKVLFELLVSSFAMMSDEQRYLALEPKNSKLIKSELLRYIDKDVDDVEWESSVYKEQERGFDYAISNSTGKRVTVLYRFAAFTKILNKVESMKFQPKGLLEK